jgi:hypothetical protein
VEASYEVTYLEEADCDVENNDSGDGSTFDPVLDTVRQGHSGDQYESESISCLI